MIDTSQASHYFASNPGLMQTGAFQHVAMTFDKAAGQTTLFLNGQPVAQTNLGVFTPLTSANLFLGYRPGSTSFNGLIDEASVHDRALTPTEIAALHAAGSAGKCFTNDPAPVFVLQPDSRSTYPGNTVTLSAAAMGTPRPSYQWLKDGMIVVGATNPTYVIPSLQTSNVGMYAVLASNSVGSVLSSNASVTISLSVNLMAYWPFNGNANDASGNGRHGTVSGAVLTYDRAGQPQSA